MSRYLEGSNLETFLRLLGEAGSSDLNKAAYARLTINHFVKDLNHGDRYGFIVASGIEVQGRKYNIMYGSIHATTYPTADIWDVVHVEKIGYTEEDHACIRLEQLAEWYKNPLTFESYEGQLADMVHDGRR